MFKRLSIILLISVLLLTGCTVSKPGNYIVPIENPEEFIDDSKNIEYKTEVFKYSEDDEIIKTLKDKIYNIDEDFSYALYPSSSYFYPEYLNIGSEIKTVYLNVEYAKEKEDVEDIYFDKSSIKDLAVGGLAEETVDGFASSGAGNYFAPEMESLNTSEYNNVEESNFLSVSTNPLSTFAADVDTASYSNLRNILRSLAQETYYNVDDLHDVRVEEMLNYFDYSFKNDTGETFKINTEISKTPWNENTQLMVVNIAAKELAKEQNEGSNLVFLIDTSGSMDNDDKLPLVKESLKLLVNELTENDTISIVTYSGSERVIIDGATGADKNEILNAIDMLVAYGFTNGEGGMVKAYEIAEKYQANHNNSRIIMCSDGDLNVGISSESELHDFVSDKRDTGIYLSVLGFGSGNYKDNKMETLADNGNGNYYYIDNIKEGHKVLIEDMMSTLVTIADDVKFQIEFNPQYIKGYRKIGYENRNLSDSDFQDDTKDGGEIGYGHSVTVVYELVPVDSPVKIASSELKYQETINTESSDWLTVSVRYKDHGEKESKLIEHVVDNKNYNEEASDDWKFISNVVGFGLIVNNSEYIEDLTINDIILGLNELELNDEDKQEFLSLSIMYHHYLKSLIKE